MYAINDIDRTGWEISSPLHNKLAEADRPVHAWYRFVLSFPPHIVREYLDRFDLASGDVVLDPFCGTGTTLVECKKQGVGSVGIEANPMAALASKAKTNWSLDPNSFWDEAVKIANAAQEEILTTINASEQGDLYKVSEQLCLYGLRDLEADAKKLLLEGSISPKPLHRSLVLKELVGTAQEPNRDHMRLALAWTLVVCAGNIRFGPEVGVTKPKDDCDVVACWLEQCMRMKSDLETYRQRQDACSTVFEADSRDVSLLEDRSISAVFTSPPYPNEKDYTRTTRLESVILGLISNRKELRNLKQGLLRSNTRNVYVNDTDDSYVADIPEIQAISAQIEEKRIAMGKDSGFERLYHRVAKLYFGGMARHFESLKPKLKKGALLGYVVGDQASYLQVHIHTGQLIAQIAEKQGYEVVSIDLFRTRLATATKRQLREEVVVLRWNG